MVPNHPAMLRALILAKQIAAKTDPGFGGVSIPIPGEPIPLARAAGGYIPHGSPERTQNLMDWFGNSVLHDDGKPRTYYHGTSKDVDFKNFKIGRHGAWFTTDPESASQYAKENDSQKIVFDPQFDNQWATKKVNDASRVLPVHLKAEKPYTGEYNGQKTENYKKDQSDWFDQLRARGYDSWVPDSEPGLAVMLKHPHQIKSAVGNIGTFDPTKPDINKATGGQVDDTNNLNDMGLYSQAAKAASALKQAKGLPQDMLRSVSTAPGVKKDELNWSGVQDKFAGQSGVAKNDLAQHFQDNMPKIREQTFTSGDQNSNSDGPTRYDDHAIPGGHFYREVLMHLPSNAKNSEQQLGVDYNSSHWDTPNVLAHLRMSDRYTPEGQKALHVEELQSDWGQHARKYGTLSPSEIADRRNAERAVVVSRAQFKQRQKELENAAVSHDDMNHPDVQQAIQAYHDAKQAFNEADSHAEKFEAMGRTVPEGPYINKTENWTDLGLKRALTEAARGNYDKLVYTPGDEQAKRYDIGQAIGSLEAHPKDPDKKTLRLVTVSPDDEDILFDKEIHSHELDEHVGQDIADKIRSQIAWPKTVNRHQVYNLSSSYGGIGHDTEEEARASINQYPENMRKDLGVRPVTERALGKSVQLSGLDLRSGGEGMKGYYDKLLPQRMLKLAREHDPEAELGHHVVEGSDEGDHMTLPGLTITPRMREGILKRGFKAFADGGAVDGDGDDTYPQAGSIYNTPDSFADGGSVDGFRNGGSPINLENYQDPQREINPDWEWRPLQDVHNELGNIGEIPSHVVKFGQFMDETANKAGTAGLTPRDLIKAYTITRASIQRKSRPVDLVRKAGLLLPEVTEKMIRPEGAFGEWLHTPHGQAYLNAAEKGEVDPEAVRNAVQIMAPFGKHTTDVPDALIWAAKNLPGREDDISRLVASAQQGESPPSEWRSAVKDVRGIGPAKAGFVASLMGRGDQPTLDARQIILNTGQPSKEAQSYISKKGGKGGIEAVNRLSARQSAMNLSAPSDVSPYYQHLAHHTIWDKASNEETTHEDLMNAMRHAAAGGRIGYSDGGNAEGGIANHPLVHAMRAIGLPNLESNDEAVKAALKRVVSPFSQDPEHVKEALRIAESFRVPSGGETGTGSFYGVKQPVDVRDVKRTVKAIPGVTPLEPKKSSWEDFYKGAKGGTLLNVAGDRMALGRLTHINGEKLAWPVDLHAGPDYMLEPNKGKIWANNPSHATAFVKKIRQAAEKGDVYGAYAPMGARAVDSAHNTFDALMAQIPSSGISPEDAKDFDDSIKRGEHIKGASPKDVAKRKNAIELLKGWPGVLNAKEASEYARNIPGGHRADIVKYMDTFSWRRRNFPPVGVTRVAISSPDVQNAAGNMLGHRIVKFDPDLISKDPLAFQHSTYTSPASGKYVSDVPLVQRHYAMPDVVEEMLKKPAKGGLVVHPYSIDPLGRSTARKLLEEQKQLQPINERMIESIGQGLENQKKYGLKDGGSVSKALKVSRRLVQNNMLKKPSRT